MASGEAVVEDDIKRMLYAGETLGRIIIFVVYVDVVM